MLQLKDIINTIPINTVADSVSVNSLLDEVIDFDVYLPSIGINLQRDYIWTAEQKSAFIHIIINDGEVSSISRIFDKTTNIIYVIDGKQRISTIINFCEGKIPLIHDGNEYYWKDISIDIQRRIKSYSFKCNTAYIRDYKKITDDIKIKWFKHINCLGTAQDAEHLNKLK